MAAITAYARNKYRDLTTNLAIYTASRDRYPAGSGNYNSYNNSCISLSKQIREMESKYPGINGNETVATKDNSKNYIEISVDGITVKKAGKQISITANSTFDFSEFNISAFKTKLAGALEVISAAAKLDPTDAKVNAEI